MKSIDRLLALFLSLLIFNIISAQTTVVSTVQHTMTCEDLENLRIPDVTISQVEHLLEPVPHCKVIGIIGTEIKFEMLLPDNWNSRFVMGGGSGFAGSIFNFAASSIKKGFATVGTDTGHEGNVINADWALNNMERQVNFGHLAVHRTAVTAKEIIRQYYSSEIAFSYFQGCSRGGGQAMMEAQRYPEDFDGIVAGAPAFNTISHGAECIQNTKAIFPNPINLDQPAITLPNLELLESIILLQCDELDGVKDSILLDPRDCIINYDLLPLCPDDIESEDCFTSSQIEAIKIIYSGVSTDECTISLGFPPGCESQEWGWQEWITGPPTTPLALNYPSLQYALGTEIFKYFVFNNPLWDYSTYNFEDYILSTELSASNLNATSYDYNDFNKNGSKLIVYHGWNDHALSALETIDYYEKVEKMDSNLRDYFRLYLLPGVLHCQNGPGPYEVDWLEIIQDWIENNNPPERVVVTKTENDEVIMTRPVFPYPRTSVYDRIGDPSLESSWIEKNISK